MDSLLVLIFSILAALVVLGLAWHFGRSQSLLNQGAAEIGYNIIPKEYRNFF